MLAFLKHLSMGCLAPYIMFTAYVSAVWDSRQSSSQRLWWIPHMCAQQENPSWLTLFPSMSNCCLLTTWHFYLAGCCWFKITFVQVGQGCHDRGNTSFCGWFGLTKPFRSNFINEINCKNKQNSLVLMLSLFCPSPKAYKNKGTNGRVCWGCCSPVVPVFKPFFMKLSHK